LFWRAARGEVAVADVERTFVSQGRLAAPSRMKIYASAYRIRQVKALADVFHEVGRLLGSEFEPLAEAYVRQFPSASPALEWLGRSFVAFLRQYPTEAAPNALVADVAALEWARNEALLAPEASVHFAPEALTQCRAESARVELRPGLRLVQVSAQALHLWPPAAQRAEDEPSALPRVVAFWRARYEVRFRLLDADEADALARVARGEPLAAVCAAFAGATCPGTRAHGVVARWVREGWILRVYEGSDG
jgi:hypothetical protein